jgi:DNA-binding GntR family transcriptional regulator
MTSQLASQMLEPVRDRPRSLTDIAFDRIRDAIVSRTLEPGKRISESMLGEMLQVSKTPVREALLRLCHVGLVEPTTRGLRVVQPNREMIRDAYEVRSGLESVAAQLASGRADADQRALIVDAAKNSLDKARDEDSAGFAEWDMAFHRSVAAATGNPQLTKAVEDAVVLAFTLRSRDVLTPDDSVHCGRQHVQIARSIKTNKPELAAKQMFDHIAEVTCFVLAAVSD